MHPLWNSLRTKQAWKRTKWLSNMTLDYGTKFPPLNQLEQILGNHPLFPELSKILMEGMDYRYREELTEEERATEVSQMMERANHQSAENEPERVKLLFNKDVTHGFSLPILQETVPH
jgi:hypothetical protein